MLYSLFGFHLSANALLDFCYVSIVLRLIVCQKKKYILIKIQMLKTTIYRCEFTIRRIAFVRIPAELNCSDWVRLLSIGLHRRWTKRLFCPFRICQTIRTHPRFCRLDRIYRTAPRMHAIYCPVHVQCWFDAQIRRSLVLHRKCNWLIRLLRCRLVYAILGKRAHRPYCWPALPIHSREWHVIEIRPWWCHCIDGCRVADWIWGLCHGSCYRCHRIYCSKTMKIVKLQMIHRSNLFGIHSYIDIFFSTSSEMPFFVTMTK